MRSALAMAARRPTLARFGVEAWWDPSKVSSITESSDKVSQVDDLTKNAHNFTQTNASEKPDTNTRTLNGINVLDFEGALGSSLDDEFDLSSNIALTGEFELWCVFSSDTASTQILWDTSQGLVWVVHSSNRIDITTPTTRSFTWASISSGVTYILRIYRDSSDDIRMELDGVDSGETHNDSSTVTVDGFSRSFSLGLNGLLGECAVIKDKSLNASQAAWVHNYLKRKWK